MLSVLFWAIWDALQIIARHLPYDKLSEEEKAHFIQLVNTLSRLLPCLGCQAHSLQWLIKNNPSQVTTGKEAFAYIVFFHNQVNITTNKPQLSLDEAESEMVQRLEGEYKRMSRGIVMEKESSAKLVKLKQEIAKLRDVRFAASNSSTQTLVIVAIVLAAVALLAIILFGLLILNRLNTRTTTRRSFKEEKPEVEVVVV